MCCGCHSDYPGGAFHSRITTTAPTRTSSFATPEPATGSSLFGGGTLASSGNGTPSSGIPAAGTSSGTNVFGSDVSNTGNALNGSLPSGEPDLATAFQVRALYGRLSMYDTFS